MKKFVPVTRVSVDAEIQRRRDIFAKGGYMDSDGSFYNELEAMTVNRDSNIKAKAVLRMVVSYFNGGFIADNSGKINEVSENSNISNSRTAKLSETKEKNVPFTSVSVDPEIQRMRDMLTSGENLVIDDDGTIGRAGDPQFEDVGNGTKAKTVPKAIVSVLESGGSVRDLINEMRGEDGIFPTLALSDYAKPYEEPETTEPKEIIEVETTTPEETTPYIEPATP